MTHCKRHLVRSLVYCVLALASMGCASTQPQASRTSIEQSPGLALPYSEELSRLNTDNHVRVRLMGASVSGDLLQVVYATYGPSQEAEVRSESLFWSFLAAPDRWFVVSNANGAAPLLLSDYRHFMEGPTAAGVQELRAPPVTYSQAGGAAVFVQSSWCRLNSQPSIPYVWELRFASAAPPYPGSEILDPVAVPVTSAPPLLLKP